VFKFKKIVQKEKVNALASPAREDFGRSFFHNLNFEFKSFKDSQVFKGLKSKV